MQEEKEFNEERQDHTYKLVIDNSTGEVLSSVIDISGLFECEYIERFYSLYVLKLVDESLNEAIIKDLLEISTMKIKTYSFNMTLEYYGLIYILSKVVQNKEFDDIIYDERVLNISKIQTIISRFAEKKDNVSEFLQDETLNLSKEVTHLFKEIEKSIEKLIEGLKVYVPDNLNNSIDMEHIAERLIEAQKKIDGRLKQKKPPTNFERIRALHVILKEEWNIIVNKNPPSITKHFIHEITGVNLEDCFKYLSGTSRIKIDNIKRDGIDNAIKMLKNR